MHEIVEALSHAYLSMHAQKNTEGKLIVEALKGTIDKANRMWVL